MEEKKSVSFASDQNAKCRRKFSSRTTLKVNAKSFRLLIEKREVAGVKIGVDELQSHSCGSDVERLPNEIRENDGAAALSCRISDKRVAAAGSAGLAAEFFGAADVGIAAFVEAQEAMGVARDADANAFADCAGFARGYGQPKRAGGAQVQAILAEIHLKCLGQTAGALADIREARRGGGHGFDAFERLDGAQKNSGADTGRFAGDIQQERRAVGEIDVRVPSLQKERLIAARLADEGMSGGVADRIGFGFHDAPAEPYGANVMDQNFADQVARQLDGIGRELGAAETAQPGVRSFLMRELHDFSFTARCGMSRAH